MTIQSASNCKNLIFSRRNINKQIFRCLIYECEDLLSELMANELLSPRLVEESAIAKNVRKSVNHFAIKVAKTSLFGNSIRSIDTGIGQTILDREYELFFSFLLKVEELSALNSVKNWRDKCRQAVCYITEIWPTHLDTAYRYRHILQEFDAIFTNNQCCVQELARMVDRPCYFLPVGIDTLRFCPYPKLPQRHIDVYSMGRRSPVTHQALLEIAREKNFFYIYDTIDRSPGSNPKEDPYVPAHQEHRDLLANLIQRSRYFINYKHSLNRGGKIAGAEELGARLFEGAAAGTIMLGVPPDCEAYREYFNWEDALIEIPYEATNIGEIIADLDAQPERLSRARRNNVVNCLLRHDWVYRWEIMLDKVGVKPTPAMENRKEVLKKLGAEISEISL